MAASETAKRMAQDYANAKQAWEGESVRCPACGTQFVKQSHRQIFCKTKGGTVCKDEFWNVIDPSKNK